jgi:hypothetical protein
MSVSMQCSEQNNAAPESTANPTTTGAAKKIRTGISQRMTRRCLCTRWNRGVQTPHSISAKSKMTYILRGWSCDSTLHTVAGAEKKNSSVPKQLELHSTNTFTVFFFLFCWPCNILYQYNETNVMHLSFNLLRITAAVSLNSCNSQLTLYARNISNAVCVAHPEDEQVMLETCRGPWFSIHWMNSASRWFHCIDTNIYRPSGVNTYSWGRGHGTWG